MADALKQTGAYDVINGPRQNGSTSNTKVTYRDQDYAPRLKNDRDEPSSKIPGTATYRSITPTQELNRAKSRQKNLPQATRSGRYRINQSNDQQKDGFRSFLKNESSGVAVPQRLGRILVGRWVPWALLGYWSLVQFWLSVITLGTIGLAFPVVGIAESVLGTSAITSLLGDSIGALAGVYFIAIFLNFVPMIGALIIFWFLGCRAFSGSWSAVKYITFLLSLLFGISPMGIIPWTPIWAWVVVSHPK